jgi:hypothetical protein
MDGKYEKNKKIKNKIKNSITDLREMYKVDKAS